MPVPIILDTNFLLIPAQFKVDIFTEIRRICNFNYRLEVVQASVDELEMISSRKDADARAAKMGLRLLKAKDVVIVNEKSASFKNADQIILDYADSGAVVATQDRILQVRLKAKGVKIIILRQKKYLKLEI